MLLALFGGILIGLSASLAHAGAREVLGVSGNRGRLVALAAAAARFWAVVRSGRRAWGCVARPFCPSGPEQRCAALLRVALDGRLARWRGHARRQRLHLGAWRLRYQPLVAALGRRDRGIHGDGGAGGAADSTRVCGMGCRLMSSWRSALLGLVCGLIFAAGLVLSGMSDPGRVLGFIDFAGDWDPRLAFVMVGRHRRPLQLAALGAAGARTRGSSFLSGSSRAGHALAARRVRVVWRGLGYGRLLPGPGGGQLGPRRARGQRLLSGHAERYGAFAGPVRALANTAPPTHARLAEKAAQQRDEPSQREGVRYRASFVDVGRAQPRHRVQAQDVAQPLRDARVHVAAKAEPGTRRSLVRSHLTALNAAHRRPKVVQQPNRHVARASRSVCRRGSGCETAPARAATANSRATTARQGRPESAPNHASHDNPNRVRPHSERPSSGSERLRPAHKPRKITLCLALPISRPCEKISLVRLGQGPPRKLLQFRLRFGSQKCQSAASTKFWRRFRCGP